VVFDVVVTVTFQIVFFFCLKMYQNNVFSFLKFIFDIITSKQTQKN